MVEADSPPRTVDILIDPDTAADDLDATMASEGYAFVEADPPAAAARTIKQIVSARLTDDGSAISQIDDWQPINCEVTLSTKAGVPIGCQITGIANSSDVEGQFRLVASGGLFGGGAVLGPDAISLSVATFSSAAANIPIVIPATPDYVTYTFALQMRATTPASSVTPRKGCAIVVVEYL